MHNKVQTTHNWNRAIDGNLQMFLNKLIVKGHNIESVTVTSYSSATHIENHNALYGTVICSHDSIKQHELNVQYAFKPEST